MNGLKLTPFKVPTYNFAKYVFFRYSYMLLEFVDAYWKPK